MNFFYLEYLKYMGVKTAQIQKSYSICASSSVEILS